jgi:hypothetical protein
MELKGKFMWESHTMDENETTWDKTKTPRLVNFLRFIHCPTFNFPNCIFIHFQTFQPFKGILHKLAIEGYLTNKEAE